MSETPNLEDLLTAIATLTEHNTALLEKIEATDQATKDRDAATAKLVNNLTAQLKDYQERENVIKSAIAIGAAKEVSKEVSAVLNHYHNQLTQGVGGHVEKANHHLVQTVNLATTSINDLSLLSSDMKKTFDANFKSLSFFSTEFEEQNRQLANDAKNTLISVRKEAREGAERYTKELSDEFARSLSWKASALVGGVCACIFALALLSVWLIVPSKAEMAKRKTDYQSLEKAVVVDNVVKGQDGYYAKIKKQSCFLGSDNEQYCKFR
ncbi:hypothetical protein [Psychrobacter faecalis]|uniref:hypothetical protein n=1 Tax=Psychrobacter faecalis TaxID=180588 RepID=UPI00191941E6|nr:hypothetical protein [Psychrobacter faecalis]